MWTCHLRDRKRQLHFSWEHRDQHGHWRGCFRLRICFHHKLYCAKQVVSHIASPSCRCHRSREWGRILHLGYWLWQLRRGLCKFPVVFPSNACSAFTHNIFICSTSHANKSFQAWLRPRLYGSCQDKRQWVMMSCQLWLKR